MLKGKSNCTNKILASLVFLFFLLVIILLYPVLLFILAFLYLKLEISFGKILENIGFYECLENFKTLDTKKRESFLVKLTKKYDKPLYSEKKSDTYLNNKKENIFEEPKNKDYFLISEKNNGKKKSFEKLNFDKKYSLLSDRKSIFDDYESVMDKF